MTTAVGTLALPSRPPAAAPARRRLPLLPVASLLQAQQELTAVERFAQAHDQRDSSERSKLYRDLIPLDRPRPGEQYAFEVDLDACTGCKACVAACHTLNGLDEGELWRTVGLLHGGGPTGAALRTVTTSCHHCVEPACMSGCPTQAYEKDPLTGIVRHLDDQCFGCQYCTLMCPYDAPKYNAARGIVRKCDLCHNRLAEGEAPACVEACPNQAIAVRVVEQAAVVQACDAGGFLPGTPTPEHTLPTTSYKSRRGMPANMLPADFYATHPEHSHPPLVVMLTLTQLAVGTFALSALAERMLQVPAKSPLGQAAFTCALAFLALGASVLHLGRPLLAWRAVLGWRTSWLSREALAFGAFAGLSVAYAALVAAPPWLELPGTALLLGLSPTVRFAAAAAGLLGVFFSVMVYVATRREQWSAVPTLLKFFGTTLILGASSLVLVWAVIAPAEAPAPATGTLLSVILAISLAKLGWEALALRHAKDRRQSTLKRVALLMLGDLGRATRLRFTLGVLGGLAIPLGLLSGFISAEGLRQAAVVMLALLLGGELTERYLFFRSAPASRMPGGLR